MSDTPKPPPLPKLPLRLVQPHRLSDELARALEENEQLRRELAAERATVQVLRQQYSERATGPHEDTLPGVGASTASIRAFQARKRASRAPRARVWVPIVAALLTAGATAAGLRYPGLMGPINDVAKAITEAIQK